MESPKACRICESDSAKSTEDSDSQVMTKSSQFVISRHESTSGLHTIEYSDLLAADVMLIAWTFESTVSNYADLKRE